MNDDKIKAFYKSKTIIFSILVAIFGVLQMNLDILKGLMTDKMYGIAFIVISVIVAVLRAITTTAVVVSAPTVTSTTDTTNTQ